MTDDPVAARIRAEITAGPIVLFMKGDAVMPQCGFSAFAVKVLQTLDVPFKTVDVLHDPAVRQGLKDFSNWPTYPQLYIKGAFIGGADIMREMFEAGELQALLADVTSPAA